MTTKLFLAAAISYACSSTVFAASWEAVAPVDTARSQFAAGVIDDQILIFGGNSIDGSNLKSMEILDSTNIQSTWDLLADNDNNNGNGVEEITGAGLNGKFYAFGAYGGGDPYGTFNFVQEYDPEFDTWTDKTDMPTLRTAAVAATYNDEIYLVGGDYFHPVTGKGTHYRVIEAYNPTTDAWRTVTNMPLLRQLPAVAVVDDRAYILGGAVEKTKKAYNNVYAYDFITNKWIKSGLSPLPTPRVFSYGHAAPVLDGKIYLVGGGVFEKNPQRNLLSSDKVEIYDPLTNTWQIGPALPQPAFFGAAVASSDAIYYLSGRSDDNDSSAVNNVWKLTDAWKPYLDTNETCDLNADGKFSAVDAALFTKACKNETAYWECDLNEDGVFNAKDTKAFNKQWKLAKKSCPTV